MTSSMVAPAQIPYFELRSSALWGGEIVLTAHDLASHSIFQGPKLFRSKHFKDGRGDDDGSHHQQ